MKKRAFTLAEVLITLGIIGVVAALTIPRIAQFNANKGNAMVLKSTVATLENAFGRAILEEGVDDIFQTSFGRIGVVSADNIAQFSGFISRYINTNNFEANNGSAYYTAKGENAHAMTNDGGVGNNNNNQLTNYFPIILKNGAVLFIRTYRENDALSNENDMIAAGTTLYHEYANIYIDTNGIKGPNVFGRDIFHFYVNQDGKLYPYGGRDISIYEESPNMYWNVACTDANKVNSGIACTGRLVDNNYEFDY